MTMHTGTDSSKYSSPDSLNTTVGTHNMAYRYKYKWNERYTKNMEVTGYKFPIRNFCIFTSNADLPHRLLLLKLDTHPCSHLAVEVCSK